MAKDTRFKNAQVYDMIRKKGGNQGKKAYLTLKEILIQLADEIRNTIYNDPTIHKRINESQLNSILKKFKLFDEEEKLERQFFDTRPFYHFLANNINITQITPGVTDNFILAIEKYGQLICQRAKELKPANRIRITPKELIDASKELEKDIPFHYDPSKNPASGTQTETEGEDEEGGEDEGEGEEGDEEETIDELENIPRNFILAGPPGTGKTYSAIRLAAKILDPKYRVLSKGNIFDSESDSPDGDLWDLLEAKKDEWKANNRLKIITFHQSFSYEEFIIGVSLQNGAFESKDGILLKFVRDMGGNQTQEPAVLIIDEINRGSISKIFGECITLIEKEKRTGENDCISIQLPNAKPNDILANNFSLPNNLFIIGTMNTSDRSIALLDFAIRRRFHFIEYVPDYNLIQSVWANAEEFPFKLEEQEIILKSLKTINLRLEVLRDKDHVIGHSFFLNWEKREDLCWTWNYQILPLLHEYFYNDWDDLITIIGSFEKNGEKIESYGFVKYKDAENQEEAQEKLKSIMQVENVIEYNPPREFVKIKDNDPDMLLRYLSEIFK